MVINVLTLLWYNPTLDQDCPPWVYMSWAVGLFLYQTFDAVDGAQAYVLLYHCFLIMCDFMQATPLLERVGVVVVVVV